MELPTLLENNRNTSGLCWKMWFNPEGHGFDPRLTATSRSSQYMDILKKQKLSTGFATHEATMGIYFATREVCVKETSPDEQGTGSPARCGGTGWVVQRNPAEQLAAGKFCFSSRTGCGGC
jgi:hypothetical protein